MLACSDRAPVVHHQAHKTIASRAASVPPAGQLAGQRQWQDTIGQDSPEIDTLARQVLANIRAHGWNPQAQTKGIVTGGLFINWKMDDPRHTNALRQGMDDATSGSHDPQVDLFYLNALAEYQTLHPNDHTFVAETQKALHLIQQEFARYSLPKGWIYFYLLRDGKLLHNDELIQDARAVASNYYTRWYDPTIGMVYNRAHTPGVYASEHSMTAGAALIDAGTRWQQSAWVQAGESTMKQVLSNAFNRSAHLFYNNMTVFSASQQQPMNTQAKPATEGAIVEALLRAYSVDHKQQYLDTAGAVLHSLFQSNLFDHQNGGLFFAKDLSTGMLQASYKETRAQIHVLIGLLHYNQALQALGQPVRFMAEEQQLIKLLATRFYQPTYHGYFYRMTPTFKIYTSSPGTGIGYENFFTTEAMGLALDSLQQTEVAHLTW
ncbi:hypothetical protein KDI_32660 [Dictyobacter arantiisoli]|uniref:D-glucuronyl C5-epimerase C-terminal domain-containing protein n=2 Tax=Dictyobacter arantiisoli TaxID=2014874 RepID=A0A5A5TE52_9CHLR|nr:hypothetical protein KDI_32660 [Dictyobacter arantiisoli]